MKFKSCVKNISQPSTLIILFLAIILVFIHIRLYQYAFDDAYIHFRVARNLFENGNPDFNVNESVKVSTSSGWTIFLAIIFGITHLFRVDNNFPFFICIANAFMSLWGMLIYTKVLEKISNTPLSLSMKLLFQIPYLAILLPSSIGLMETPFALLVAGVGIYFLLQSKPSGFAFLGFSAYIRLELIILVVIISLLMIIKKQFPLHQILGFEALGFTPLLIYDLYFFHTVIPHSIIAKSIVYSISWFQSAIYIMFSSLPSIPSNNIIFVLSNGAIFLSIVLITTFTIWTKSEKNFWHILFSLWGFFIIIGYVIGHTLIFPWYIPLYSLPIIINCSLCSISTESQKNIITKSILPVLFTICATSMLSVLYASTFDPSFFSLFENNARVKVYLQVGSILNEEYPNAKLLTSEIGSLGYSFKGEILDAAGLASPEALHFHPMKIPEQRLSGAIGAIPPEYVKENMPEIIVSYDSFDQALLHNDVISEYNVILIPAYLPDDAAYSENKTIWGSKYLRVFIRKDLPVSERILELGK